VLQFESARKAAERAKSEARPDLELALGVQSNGVDLRGNPTFGEVFRMDHPAYQLGVNFTMPLGFSAEKARAVSAAADAVRSEAQSSLEREGLPTLWMNLCLDLFRNQRAFELNRTSQEQQALRANLEEERFKIGRSSMLMVIQAGDDATLAELALKRSEVERRLAAWRVRRLTGGLQKYVEKLLAAGGAP
jgi:outer membrane protein TolC